MTTNPLDYNGRSRVFKIFSAIVLVLFAAVWVVPLLFAGVTSLRPESEIAADPTSWWSENFSLEAYRKVLDSTPMLTWYLNSFIIAALTVVLTVFVTSLIGFALAQTRFRGRGGVFALVLAGLLIPGQILVLPLYQIVQGMGLLNTYWAMVLPAVAAPIAVFIFESFFSGLPRELIDAARVDGTSWFGIYWRICLPLTRPAVAAVAIFTFVTSWNNFLWPLLVLSNVDQMTIPVGMATVASGFGIMYAQVMATAVLGALPLFVVFLLFQRQIVQGVASTGIK
ncbi:multiple sugar transport system permease protein [Barrientosiimonas humi]|uniref:Multiple sugar transport system permease protein n=1 Tax=Barrientosiimonas humi TaxID=999931 RepID=A0A542XGB1_9MICO|nr:carbohydrate ABC transporter permease [Barrientosiimonas humi]TQL34858.1 multiple sugar transport system permease protein [Barrientosiimonas humi]CAG7571028.1 L-arabinose transport system permease protein AraQ [Barrientosiimonas humi]